MRADIRHRLLAFGLLAVLGGVAGIGAIQGCGDSATVADKRAAACEHVCECGGSSSSCAASCGTDLSNSFSVKNFSASTSDETGAQAAACFDCIAAASCEAFANEDTCRTECRD